MLERKNGDCKYCGGFGFTEEHDPNDPHEDGQCCSCPIQVPCGHCYTTGYEPFKRVIFIEMLKKEQKTNNENLFWIDDYLPF